MKKYNILLAILILYIIINMVIYPQIYINQTLNGISAWAFNVLPSILPFIFFTKILTMTGMVENVSRLFMKPCKKLFNTPAISAYVFLTSAISGYPVGAKMTSDLYCQGKITKNDAFKMTSFCSTSGPMFIIGAVGIGMLKNALYGYIIFIAHILGAIINGICYKKLKIKDDNKKNSQEGNQQNGDLSSMVLDSALSVISVGVIIAIFFVVITSLSPIFNLFPLPISSVLEGLIEITRGCIDISSSISSVWSIVACTFIISFGGISTILQSLTMLNKLNMPIWLFVLQKFTHAIIASMISIIFIVLI